MTKKNNLISDVFEDFRGKVGKRAKPIIFSKKISKSTVYISKKTGTVYHSPNISAQESLSAWSEKIYSKKIDTNKILYTSNNPIMKSRHYYSALFLNDVLKNKKIKFCDYGAGEGNFGCELLRINKKIQFNFTEDSPHIYKNAYNWTLCNCVKPLEILETIHKSLKENGLLLISESSRILVPFKKPIYNFFVQKYETQNTHPWYFSFNSLSNLLEISGFRIIKNNRYYDENDLVIIAQKKNKKNHRPIIKKDNLSDVIKFFKEWERISQLLKNIS